MSAGQPIEIEVYGRLAGRLCRLLELIGIRRLTKPLDPMSELAKELESVPKPPVPDDDENEPAAIEAFLDREPGKA